MVDTVRGLVRPVVTILMAVAFVIYTYLEIVDSKTFTTVAGMIFAFWFQGRTEPKPNGPGVAN